MKLSKKQQIRRTFATLEWRSKYDATNWQRILVMMFVCALVLIAVPLNLLGLAGPTSELFTWLNIGQYVFVVATLILLWLRVLRLDAALGAILTMVQCFMAMEMFQCATVADAPQIVIIFGDTFLSFSVIMLSITANFRILTFVLSAVAICAYASCIAITRNAMLINFAPLTLFGFLLIPILGYMFVRNFRRLETENMELKDTERNVLDALGIDKKRALEFVRAKKKGRVRMTDFFKESAIWKLRDEIEEMAGNDIATLEQIKAAIPELTPSEAEIAMLIIQGHKTGEICMRLGKEKGNVTSQRTHIRTKLGLTDSRADLRSALAERLAEV